MHILGDGRYPFHCAAYKRDVEAVRRFLESGRHPDERDSHHYTPLHHAVWNITDIREGMNRYRLKELIGVIAEYKPDFNATGNLGQTPLHIAARCDNYYGVLHLLEYEEVKVDKWALKRAEEFKEEHGYCLSVDIIRDRITELEARRRCAKNAGGNL